MKFSIDEIDRRPVLTIIPEDEIELLVIGDLCRAGSDLGAVLSGALSRVTVRVGEIDDDTISPDPQGN